MRVYKRFDERLNEILDVSSNLFAIKGYEKTTVNDILDGVGIGKGTFYHYFKSKEDVMDAVIMRIAGDIKTAAQAIADMPELSALEKFRKVFTDRYGKNDDIVEQLHHSDNSTLHTKSLTEAIIALTPALTQIIEQGIDEGVFNTPYPKEGFEILFTASQYLFDPGIFKWPPDELLKKVKAYTHILEIVLGTKSGCFDFLLTLYKQ